MRERGWAKAEADGLLVGDPGCAYKKGVCAMCAKQILDTTQYKMSSK